MDEKTEKLITGYFEFDIMKCNLKEKTKNYIVNTFTFLSEQGVSLSDIHTRRKGDKKISKGRNFYRDERIEDIVNTVDWIKITSIKAQLTNTKNNGHYKPYPIRLGELKPELMQEAYNKNISLHKRILLILQNRIK